VNGSGFKGSQTRTSGGVTNLSASGRHPPARSSGHLPACHVEGRPRSLVAVDAQLAGAQLQAGQGEHHLENSGAHGVRAGW
jgi:hypothetical protein